MVDFDSLLREHYGLSISQHSRLDGESALSEKITTTDGEHFVVKVWTDVKAKSHVEIELAVLERLAKSELRFKTPKILRTLNDEVLCFVGEAGVEDWARVVSWIPGQPWRSVTRPSSLLLHQFGAAAAQFVNALDGLDEHGLNRTHAWDMRAAPQLIGAAMDGVENLEQRRVLQHVADVADKVLGRYSKQLPSAIVHQDLNDFNVLVERQRDGQRAISGVIDVGDALASWRITELAVASAYAILRATDPLLAIGDVVAGFDAEIPLTDEELAVVVPLAVARLAMNFAKWTGRAASGDNVYYATERMKHTWAPLSALAALPASLGEAQVRNACGRPRVISQIVAGSVHSMFVERQTMKWIDLSPTGDSDVEPTSISDDKRLVLAASGESRLSRAARRTSEDQAETVHLGLDVFLPVGEPVYAPWSGICTRASDTGFMLTSEGKPSLVLRGIERFVDRAEVGTGEQLGVVAGHPCDADAPTHVHVQLGPESTSLLPNFVSPDRANAWTTICPDPATALFSEAARPEIEKIDSVIAARREHLASSQRSYYQRPMNLERASGVWFTDDESMRYLDAINNVTHVGHGHPRVVAAAARQMRRLNTNSRFVYPELAHYCERLTSTLPEGLDVVFLVCTGSEANDLALRIARTVTDRSDVITIDGAYHGNTTAVNAVSPNRYKGAGGSGRPPGTWEVAMPDRYRGPYGYNDADAGLHYARDAAKVVETMMVAECPPAAVISESLMGTAGQIVHPEGFLRGLFESVRSAGGLCISDEVQVGFGRLGETFWGFEMHGVVPDIVTMGKPMGNGHPMSAVVTTREIANAFDTGMKYFNTFGGNPVSCAVGLAVLEVIEEEGLQQHALETGTYFQNLLSELQSKHALIGDVRGQGLYIGVELVLDRLDKVPATVTASLISERMKEEGVIVGTNGRYDNVLKIKPPMVFGRDDVELFATTLGRILEEFS